jgi:two-component system phosphate regulon sensor histidine kinase PhoR
MGIDSVTPVPVLQTEPAAKTQSMRLRVFGILLAAFLIMIGALATCLAFTLDSWQNDFRAEIQRDLTQKARMFASEVDHDHTRGITALTSQEGQNAGARATVIDMNGKVIADSEVRVFELNDEGRRPEFVAALRGETGTEIRSRGDFGVPVVYVAVPVSGGAVRLASPLADIGVAASHSKQTLIIGCIIAAIVACGVSAGASLVLTR